MRLIALLPLMAIAPAGGCAQPNEPIRFHTLPAVRAKLQPGLVHAAYVRAGGDSVRPAMEGLRPLSLVSGDLNTDGYPDLVAGYAARDGGVLIVHLANPEAFSPLSPAALGGVARGEFPPPFQATATVLTVPAAPDYLALGDFCRDSRPSILYAARGARSLSVLAGDGSGHFQAARSVPLPGKLTALAAGSLRANDGGASVVAGVENDAGGALVVYEAALGGVCGVPAVVPAEGAVTGLAIGNLDGDPYADVALISGGQLRILHGRRVLAKADVQRLDTIATAGTPVAIAIGRYSVAKQSDMEIAALGPDGVLRILGRDAAGAWKPAAAVQATADPNGAKLLSGRIAGAGVDDLVVLAPSDKRMALYGVSNNRAAEGEPRVLEAVADLDSESAPVAVLPMRLNVMGSPGLVMLMRDSVDPVELALQPGVTYKVTLASDSQNGTCTAPSGSPLASTCTTLRAAVAAANANPGQDAIVFDASLNGTPVVLNAGRMVVTDALTIIGNGPASTQIWGGPGPSSGVDSVFSFNAGGFLPGFAVSISGLTIQYGLNAGALGYPDGGALDFSGSAYDGSGSLAIANCNILQNGTTNGFGGGLGLFYGGTVTISNATISGNQARTPGTDNYYSGYGGGIFVGLAGPNSTNVTITNSSISGNSASTPGQTALSQDGGGIYSMPGVVDNYPLPYAYYYNSIAIHGSSISNNQASGQGAGLNGHFLIDQNSVISGNAALGYGGGVFGWFAMNHSSLTNNSSPLDGSAVYQLDPGGIEGDPSQPLSSIHSSRIVGNGPAGVLAVDACVGVDVTNNWWGSNASPASQVNSAVVTFSPWLVMTLAAPSSVYAGATGTLTATITKASDGSTGFAVADGTPAAFSGTLGTVNPPSATTLAGSASSTYTAGSTTGAASVSATIDSQTLTASFNVSPSPLPTLATISPASGAQGTSVPVTLTGTNFVAGATVTVSNTGITVSNVAVVSATQITATLTIGPTAAQGAANVTVTTSGGTSNAVVFMVNAPVAVAVTPTGLSMYASETQPFQATVTNTSNTAVTWSLNPNTGTIDATGLYTSPATIASQQTVTVTATSAADSSKSGSTSVLLYAGIPPGTVSLPNAPAGPTTGVSGTVYQFTASGAVSSLRGDSVRYSFNWGDGTNSPWTALGVSSASHSWPMPGVYLVTVRACSATNMFLVSNVSAGLTVTIGGESVSAATTPTGPASGVTGTQYTFTTGGAASSLGHLVQYTLLWGDGSPASVLPVGSTSASHSWQGPGTYTVTAQARCSTDTLVQGPVSGGTTIVMTASETISTPATPNGPASGAVRASYSYSAGGSVSSAGNPVVYVFLWGDGSPSPWLPQGVTTASHAWSKAGSYLVTVLAADAKNLLIQSAASGALTVQIH